MSSSARRCASRARFALASAAGFFAAACASAGAPRGAPVPVLATPGAREIARLEDARSDGNGRLVELAQSPDPALRERAAVALGRLPFPEHAADVTRALVRATYDRDARVRAAAAFALGLRGDASAADRLAFLALDHHDADAEPLVRARALEAASKLERPELWPRLLEGLGDADPAVRLEAATAPHRWPPDAPEAEGVDLALVRHLDSEPDPRVRWYALAALERRKAEAAREAFLRFSGSPHAYERLFAVRGLARLALDPSVDARLREAARDGDWRVSCEAVLGLRGRTDGESLRALARATAHESAHVRRCAWESAGALGPEHASAVLAAFAGAGVAAPPRAEGSEAVRAAALEACLRLRPAALEELRGADPRAFDLALARAAGHWPRERALAPLLELSRREDLVVAGAAIESLGRHPSPGSRERLRELLRQPDNGLRLAAVLALAELPDAGDLPHLAQAYRSSEGDIAAEVAFNALRAAAKLGGEGALELLRQALSDPRPFVRRVAREELERSAPGESPTGLAPAPAAETDRAPLPEFDFPVWERNPMVAIDTTRGTLVFELLPAEAPVHVHSFLDLARRGHYDGLDFHRVVPDFVIQGGCYRGDGNGGTTFRVEADVRALHSSGATVPADSLRHEIGPRKYARGSLGMPRNEDPDSGGSQIFVTHRPTPHLDGRYTIFGELRGGADGVLDAIEVGERILAVRLLD